MSPASVTLVTKVTSSVLCFFSFFFSQTSTQYTIWWFFSAFLRLPVLSESATSIIVVSGKFHVNVCV